MYISWYCAHKWGILKQTLLNPKTPPQRYVSQDMVSCKWFQLKGGVEVCHHAHFLQQFLTDEKCSYTPAKRHISTQYCVGSTVAEMSECNNMRKHGGQRSDSELKANIRVYERYIVWASTMGILYMLTNAYYPFFIMLFIFFQNYVSNRFRRISQIVTTVHGDVMRSISHAQFTDNSFSLVHPKNQCICVSYIIGSKIPEVI